MNKIVRVQFGNTEISAGSENEIALVSHSHVDGVPVGLPTATKRDLSGRLIQAMILGPGCVITYQEVQA